MFDNIFFLPDNIAPYQIARFNALAKTGLKFEVVLVATKQHSRPWDGGESIEGFKVVSFGTTLELHSYIKKIKKTVNLKNILIYGYIKVMRDIAKLFHGGSTRCGIFIDCHESVSPKWYKELFKKYFLSKYVDFAVVPGSLQYHYTRKLGVPKSEIHVCPLSINNEHFNVNTIGKVNVYHDYFLTVSRLSLEKNIKGLIINYSNYVENGGSKKLVIIGDGPLKPSIEQMVLKLNLMSKVSLLGWLSYEEIVGYYLNAYSFVLASNYEPWGVVINEAVASCLPLITSRECGSNMELSREYVNALYFSSEVKNSLSEQMLEMERNSYLYHKLKKGSELLGPIYNSDSSAFILKSILK